MTVVSSCSDERGADDPVTPADDRATYVRLLITVPVSSRANPSGGEDGDGLEPGIRHENEIEDLTLFFYRDPTRQGLALPSNTPFESKAYLSGASLTTVSDNTVTGVYRVDDYLPVDGDRVLVVANMGDLTAIGTLGDLRDHLVEDPWKSADKIADYKRFAMATASNDPDDGIVAVKTHSGSSEDPFSVAVKIERTAARIDIWFNNATNNGDGELLYDVKPTAGGDGAAVAMVHVTNILPINVMQSPTYTFKRVTATSSVSGDIVYCGVENTDESTDIPSNYVIEPHTTAKSADMKEDALELVEWYGDTRAAYVRLNYSSLFDDDNSISSYFAGDELHQFTQAGYDFDSYVTLAYANENTQDMSLHDSRFITGLLFKAVYEPTTVYSDGEATVKDSRDYALGQTFWRYSPSRQDVIEGDCLYFSNEEAVKAYAAAHPEDIAQITCFDGGICYYNLWLRHANADKTDPHETCPMEYGTVRNNIYRVGISFTGAGDPTPVLREPNNINARIFVRKWNFRPQPVITF